MTEEPSIKNTRTGIAARRGKKFLFGANILTATLLLGILWYMVNYLASRHYLRYDISRLQFYQLAPQTRDILSSLKQPLEIFALVREKHAIYPDVMNLLSEYEAASRLVKVHRIDPDRDMIEAQMLAKRFSLTQADQLIFYSDGRSQRVTLDGLMNYDAGKDTNYRRVIFDAERHFSTAIFALSQGNRPVLYFLTGHGEHEMDDNDRNHGYSKIARLLEQQYMEIRKLQLGFQRTIPEDCDALIIAGPDRKLPQSELDIIARYVEQNGRLLILLEAGTNTGLEELLRTWGVEVGEYIVYDPAHTLTGKELYIWEYGQHPLIQPLQGSSVAFFSPRSVEGIQHGESNAAQAKDEPQISVLTSCSTNGWLETDLKTIPPVYDMDQDRKGPISVAVAVEKGGGLDVDVSIKPTRMVIIGDADFLSNGLLSGGGHFLISHTVNWLLDRKELLNIPSKSVDEIRLAISKSGMNQLFFMLVLLIPGGIAVLGLCVWIRRRS